LHHPSLVNLIGEHVGNYVVTRELGSGGMGTVYLAEHPVLGRKVAIKVLHDHHSTDKDTVARFFQEARAAAEIGEEHIIEVIDFGELLVRGWKVVYLMMELLDGMSLGKRLQQGPMPADEIAHVVLQVCLALAASHAKGIIHRDLKPENIYLCPRASDPLFTKVLDFGIAKLTGATKASAHTRLGTVLGTPAYMSPEQCLGTTDIDGRADIYAMGVVLFEMLTGQLPFTGGVGDLIEAHVHHPPDPPSRRNPAVTPGWDAIVLHCLEKARDDRFPSILALAAAIRDPIAHLVGYQQQVAARATAPAPPHRTAVLPVELHPELGAPAVGPGLGPAPAQAAPPMPQPFSAAPPAFAADLGRAPTLSVTPTPPPFAATVPLATPGPFVIPAPLGARSFAAPTPVRAVAPHRATLWIAAAAGAAVSAAAVFGIGTLLRWRSDDAGRPAAVPPPAATAPVAVVDAPVAVVDAPVAPAVVIDAAPRPIELTITSTPSNAQITIHHGAVVRDGVTPYVVELAPDATPATITVTAPGYASITRTLIPRVNAEIVVVLQRSPPSPPRPRRHPTSDDLIRP
jgi:serine/threonine-protein kinase